MAEILHHFDMQLIPLFTIYTSQVVPDFFHQQYDNMFAQHPLQKEVTFGWNELHWAALRFEREMVQDWVRKGLEAAPN